MRKDKKPEQTYENFCKVFAGVFRKHVYSTGGYATCYIRDAIRDWATATDSSRVTLEDLCRSDEDAVGYRIAKALLAQGWCADIIVLHTNTQQEYVDAVDDFLIVLGNAGYVNEGFSSHANGRRYQWLMDGGPSLEEFDYYD